MQGNRTMIFSDAEAYDRRMGRHSRILASVFIRFIGGIHDGDRVLDVGCGTGSLAFTIANTTRASKIVGIDLSEPFIEYNRSTNADPRVTFEVGDAHQLTYLEASFDKSLFLLAIQFVSNPPQVVAEMRRVTRPGGIVALCSWDSTGGMEMITIFKKAAKALDPSAEFPSDSAAPRKEGTIRALLIESGLSEVEENALTIQMNFDSFDDIWLPFSRDEGPEGSYMVKLSPEHKLALHDKFRQDVLQGRPDGPLTLQARAWAARGKVPDQ